MRTTNNMLINNMMYYMNNNLNRMSKYQSQMATGKKIDVPSDDPIVAARALKLRTDVSEVGQFKSNANDAYSWMDMTESALGKLDDILQDAREKAVDASNDTKTPEDRQKIQQVISQLKDQVVHIANTSYAGRYIFSGYATDTKLLGEDGKYLVSAGSNETAVIKGGLVNLSGSPINSTTNNTFEISSDGINFYKVTIASGVNYNGTTKNADDLAKEIQSKISSAVPIGSASPTIPAELKDIKVTYNKVINNDGTSNSGRFQFSLGDTTDVNGNKVNIHLRESGTNDLLKSLKIKTEGAPGVTISKSEDVKYQVGIGDLINVNVPGTSLFGTGIKGEVGDFMVKFDSYINSLTYPEGKSILTGQALTVNSSNKLDMTTTNQFNIKIEGMAGFIAVPALDSKVYDGQTGKTLNDLAADMQSKINSAVGPTYHVTVANENGKIVMSENGGRKIILQEGSPSQNALKAIGIYTGTDKTVSSVTAHEGIDKAITDMQDLLNRVLSIRSDVGARMNRIELTQNRLDSDELNFTKLMSENEDVDEAEVIMKLQNEENVYRASLAGGARIIMPTLIDFLR